MALISGGRRPRIGINAHLLNLGNTYRAAGIGTYARELLQRLPEAAPDLECHVFSSEAKGVRLTSDLRWHISRLPTHHPLIRIGWEQLVAPGELRRHGVTVLHSLGFVTPLLTKIASVVTVFDLSFIVHPALFSPWRRVYLRLGTGMAARRAARVIAISENTKCDLVRAFHVPGEKITVIHCGVDEEFWQSAPDSAMAGAVALPERFVLHVGTIERRKNIGRLLRAFGRAKRAARLPHHLVLAGAVRPSEFELQRAIDESGIRSHVLVTGYVPAATLREMYRKADLLVYPSLYEGFGLPPLEGMASGTPVIASNRASLPTVVGDAGIQVDPEDEQALSDAIVSVLVDPAKRDVLRERGFRQARKFSWQRTAEETAQVYRDVVAGSR